MENAYKTKPHYVLCASFGSGEAFRDEWEVHETLVRAREAYKVALEHPDIYCACITLMLEGTDWPEDTETP